MGEFFLPSDIAEIADRLGDTTQAFDNKTILLCGGRGFLGRYFAEVFMYLNKHVLETPCEVIVLDNLITASKDDPVIEDRPHYEFVKHNIVERFTYEKPINFIIQVAGIASPFYYKMYPLETLEVATLGTKNLLDLAKEHRATLLFFSSSEIYGDPDPAYVPTPESYRGNVYCLGPRACYDESKRMGETLCRVYKDQFGVVSKIVRPFNVYGPGMREGDYRVLPNFASRIVAKRPLQVYGSGNQTRTFSYITDAMVGFIKVLVNGRPGEAYNIGNSEPEISVLDLVKEIEEVLGSKLEVSRIEYPDTYPADEPKRRCPDITKVRLQLGYEPMISLQEGLRRFFDWAMANYIGEAQPF